LSRATEGLIAVGRLRPRSPIAVPPAPQHLLADTIHDDAAAELTAAKK